VGLDEKIWIARYQLRSKGLLNARSERGVFEGALIRRGSGFSALHPWPELGDPSLDECLEDLANQKTEMIVQKALMWLSADACAREEGRSLFEQQPLALNHATIPQLTEQKLSRAVENGFGFVKTKVGRQFIEELEFIQQLSRSWPELRWRIDFNGLAQELELREALSKWSEQELSRIDFLEDPIMGHAEDWSRLSLDLGLCLASDRWGKSFCDDSKVRVLKPAVDLIEPGPGRRVVTSYMDHPIGQSFAAWESLKIDQSEVFGLMTHELFEPSDFSEFLGLASPVFTIPDGTGIGFDDCLEQLDWKVL